MFIVDIRQLKQENDGRLPAERWAHSTYIVEYISLAKMLRFCDFCLLLFGTAARRSGHLAVHLLVLFHFKT